MYEHLEPYESYPREYLEVVLDEPATTADPAVSTFVLVHGAFRGGWAWQPGPTAAWSPPGTTSTPRP